MNRYYARSASDKTDDWPFWFIADNNKGGLNVTVEILPELRGYLPFVPKGMALFLEKKLNELG